MNKKIIATGLALALTLSCGYTEAVSKQDLAKARQMYLQGVQQYQSGETKKAAQIFMEADNLAEDNPLYEIFAGDSLRALKQYPASIRYYKDALDHVKKAKRDIRDKIKQRGYLGLARSYFEDDKETEALSYADKAIKEFPDDYSGHYVKGLIYLNNPSEQSLAETELRKAIDIDKTQYNPYVKLIKLQNKQGNMEGVIETYKMAVDYRPIDEPMKMALAQVYISETKKEGSTKNYYPEAKEVLKSLIGLNQKNALAHYYLSALYILTDDKENCYKEMGILNGLNPNLGRRLSLEVQAYEKKHGMETKNDETKEKENKLFGNIEEEITLDSMDTNKSTDNKEAKKEEDKKSGKENPLVSKQIKQLEKLLK